jgi:molybdate transport system ATP-binding protein
VTALCGPSGSGKTTALSIIAGLRKPDAGFIRLGDTVLCDSQKKITLPPEARRIGYVFQQHLLFPHLGSRENLLYGWKRRGPSARRVEADHIIEILDLAAWLDRKPATLSGGQRQRVALGRALLCSPELLLLDEPLTSLDDELKRQISSYIERILAEWHVPTILVTHDLDEVSHLATRTIQLKDGRVAAADGFAQKSP